MAETTATEPTPTPAPTPAPTGDPPAATPTPPAPTNGHDTDWRATITDPKVKEFAAQHASITDLATSALGLRQKLSKAIVLPGKDAKPEDKAAFRKAWGVPDAPDKYELAPAEGQTLDEGFKGLMAKTFHDLDINGEQAKGLNSAWNGYLAEQTAARNAAIANAGKEQEAALRKEWPGAEFDANVKHARAAAKAFGGEDFLAWVEKATVDGISVGDHPRFLKTFAQIGRRMGEDSSHMAPSADDVASTKDEISKLRSDLADATRKGDQSGVNRIRASLDAAYEKAFPGKRQF